MYVVSWEDNIVAVGDDRAVVEASSAAAHREAEKALKDPVLVMTAGDATRTIRPGDDDFIPHALRRLSPCTITGGPDGR